MNENPIFNQFEKTVGADMKPKLTLVGSTLIPTASTSKKAHKRKQTEVNDGLISIFEFCPADEEILKKIIEVYP